MARDKGLTEKVFILGGVTPLKSPGMARYMNNKVAGMDVPQNVIDRMDAAPKKNASKEGVKICLETIAELRETAGIHGVHIMAIEWEGIAAEIVVSAGLNLQQADG